MQKTMVLEVANDLLSLIRRDGFDPTTVREEMTEALRPFVAAHDELEELYIGHGVKRPEPPDRSRLLFYSPELLLTLSRYGPDFRLPTHNHQAWNVLLICTGEMQFRWYRRLDDRSEAGRADLEIADDRVVRAGEAAFIAPPPHDIHALEILKPGTWMLTIQPETEPALREIYDADAGTFEIMSLSAARDRLESLV